MGSGKTRGVVRVEAAGFGTVVITCLNLVFCEWLPVYICVVCDNKTVAKGLILKQ